MLQLNVQYIHYNILMISSDLKRSQTMTSGRLKRSSFCSHPAGACQATDLLHVARFCLSFKGWRSTSGFKRKIHSLWTPLKKMSGVTYLNVIRCKTNKTNKQNTLPSPNSYKEVTLTVRLLFNYCLVYRTML